MIQDKYLKEDMLVRVRYHGTELDPRYNPILYRIHSWNTNYLGTTVKLYIDGDRRNDYAQASADSLEIVFETIEDGVITYG